ncbi:MAG TPA: hypothetical protein VJ888_09615 [Mobilitalea sp.]|nr:hypothetical protein [Mobilitalea sp.]
MRKLYIKIMAFICVVVYLFSFVEPLSAKAMPTYSKYEVDYVFKTEDGISIPKKVLQIDDCESYYFQDYIDEYDSGETNTYRLYEKDSGEPYGIGGSYGIITLFNDDIYLIKNGICIVNQFYYIGIGDDDCEYWMYFGDDGKMVKGNIINGAIKIDKNGFFDYRQSDLYKRTLELFIQEETERARLINDGEDIRKQYAKKGYSKKKIDQMINKNVSDYVKESVKNYSPDIYRVTDILNKEIASNLGKWVKIEDYVAHKPLFTTDGHFVKDKKGLLLYWANSILKNTVLVPSSSVLNYRKFLEGYKYLPDDTYDWKTTVIAENENLSDILVEIDGDYYYFNEKGYAEKNKWVSLDYEDYYFDGTGKRVTKDWMAKDGELYRLDHNGSIINGGWVNEDDGNTYLSFDGTIYYAAKDKEFEIREKISEFARRPSAGTEVGICSKFADMLVHYLFGKNAKGTKYSYDWDKIKVGDTISGDNHIFVVMEKGRYCITAAESNWNGDLVEHYGRVPLDKAELDELSKKGKMRYTFTTYYSSAAKRITDFKPQKVKLSAKSSNNMVTIKLDKSKGAVGYCIYMSNSKDGDYKRIKTIKAEDELKYEAKKLSSGDYYFKARAYRIINNKKIWGEYSSIVKRNIRTEAN